MYPNEAIKICENKINEIKKLLKKYENYDGTPDYQKQLEFYELVKTALEYFDKC